MKIAITGVEGLLGWQAAGRLHASACAARYQKQMPEHDLIAIDRASLNDASLLATILAGVEAVLHFAGVNRGSDEAVANGNPDIAKKLIEGCIAAGIKPHIIYANSTQATNDSVYGNSKRRAGETLAAFTDRYTDLVLPHIFGECAKPDYNNVTATLIDRIWKSEEPEINPNGRVSLLHAGAAAELAINCALTGRMGRVVPQGRDITVPQLYERLKYFHELYECNTFPPLSDAFDLALFNAYRTGGFPGHYPREIKLNRDERGILFESAKGGDASQTFLSTTRPGQSRGDHFHLDLVERFVVVKGDAIIRVRRVLTNQIEEFAVSGESPVAVDMPPLHTHHIVNVGNDELLTFFWAHRVFNPVNPDTFADPVLGAA